MSRLASRIVLACVCGVALACRHAPPSIPDQARLYAGVGRYHRVVSTKNPEAQRWFDQGLLFLYGFNHDEAIRSFTAAAHRDPDCAQRASGASSSRRGHAPT